MNTGELRFIDHTEYAAGRAPRGYVRGVARNLPRGSTTWVLTVWNAGTRAVEQAVLVNRATHDMAAPLAAMAEHLFGVGDPHGAEADVAVLREAAGAIYILAGVQRPVGSSDAESN